MTECLNIKNCTLQAAGRQAKESGATIYGDHINKNHPSGRPQLCSRYFFDDKGIEVGQYQYTMELYTEMSKGRVWDKHIKARMIINGMKELRV